MAALTGSTATLGYPVRPDTPSGPNPIQQLAHDVAPHVDEFLFGGANGPGKTDWLIAEVLMTLHEWPGMPGIIFRDSYPNLSQASGIIPRLLARVPRSVGAWNGTDHRWNFANGSTLQLSYMSRDSDVGNHLGGEHLIQGWDQLDQHTEYQYRILRTRLRIPEWLRRRGARPRSIATANPGGRGHSWIRRRWRPGQFDRVHWRPEPTDDEPTPGTRYFLPGRVGDNPDIDSGYVARLQALPPDERRARLEGDWDVYVGQRFTQWRAVPWWDSATDQWRMAHVIEPGDLPIPLAGLRKAVGIDYGTRSPFCALWGARLTEDLTVVYREVYRAGLTARQQAEAVLAAEAPGERDEGRPLPVYIDPTTYAKGPDDQSDPPAPGLPPPGSIAHTYRMAGLPVRKANNARRAGVSAIDELLTYGSDGLPRLLVYSTCRNLCRTLPELQRDTKHDPEDVDTNGEDHAYDALRYLVMGLGSARPRSPAGDDAPAVGPPTLTAGLRRSGF